MMFQTNRYSAQLDTVEVSEKDLADKVRCQQTIVNYIVYCYKGICPVKILSFILTRSFFGLDGGKHSPGN